MSDLPSSNQNSAFRVVIDDVTAWTEWDGRRAESTRAELIREILRLTPAAESWESYVAAQERKGQPVETPERHLQPKYVLEQIMNNSTDPWAKGVARTCLMGPSEETTDVPSHGAWCADPNCPRPHPHQHEKTSGPPLPPGVSGREAYEAYEWLRELVKREPDKRHAEVALLAWHKAAGGEIEPLEAAAHRCDNLKPCDVVSATECRNNRSGECRCSCHTSPEKASENRPLCTCKGDSINSFSEHCSVHGNR